MKITILLFILTIASFSAFAQTMKSLEEMVEDEKFEFVTEPQEAVFYIGFGYTGGPGTMPVLSLENWHGRPKYYNDLPIYFDELFYKEVSTKLPACSSGPREIRVSATIQLVQDEGPISTPNPQTKKYYEAKVIELRSVEVNFTPCEK